MSDIFNDFFDFDGNGTLDGLEQAEQMLFIEQLVEDANDDDDALLTDDYDED